MRASKLLVLLALSAAGIRALAEEGVPREVAFEELAAWKPQLGADVRVTGKYKELVNDELFLFDCDTPFLLRQAPLLQKLLEFKPQWDNLTLAGRTVEKGEGLAVEVDEISGAPTDLEVFTRKAEAIRKGEKKERVPGLLALGKLIVLSQARYENPELRPLARRVFRQCIEEAEDAEGEKDVASSLALIREIHGLLRERTLVVEALIDLEKRFPGDKRILDFFSSLNCRRYQDRWVTYEDFKRLEGLVEQGGRWITPREKDLIDSLDAFRKQNLTNLILRKRTDREYRLLAEKGSIEEGMKSQEVYLSLGFPDRVERRLYQQKEFDQWSYGSKYYYFYEGLLVAKSK